MNLNERIANVKPYFLLFNISAEEDAIYAVAKFPDNWTVPDRSALKSTYKVEIAPMNNGICFATETKNGAECVFDALDYVIKFNRSVEERIELLRAKITELKDIFSKEDIEKLKTLTFVFDEPKKRKGSKKASQETVQSSEEQVKEENVPQQETENIKKAEEPSDDSSLMAFAKNIVDD